VTFRDDEMALGVPDRIVAALDLLRTPRMLFA
jgi:hypothetical protein